MSHNLNITSQAGDEHARETAQRRADLLARAEAQGVKPFTSIDDFAGDPELTADFDVEEFLCQVREDRDRIANRGNRQ